MAVLLDDGRDLVGASTATGMSLDLFEILVCPVDRNDLRLTGLFLDCPECGRRYAIADGIPNMLVEESQPASVA